MEKNLMDLDNFTSTSPIAFRSNLKLELKDGGFSSYQSDYPFSMTNKSGSIASPLSTLLNKDADKNFIILKNIFHLPVRKNSNIYFLDLKKKKILDQQTFKSNTSNIIKVDKNGKPFVERLTMNFSLIRSAKNIILVLNNKKKLNLFKSYIKEDCKNDTPISNLVKVARKKILIYRNKKLIKLDKFI